jgi:hypothetical protein
VVTEPARAAAISWGPRIVGVISREPGIVANDPAIRLDPRIQAKNLGWRDTTVIPSES